MWSKNNDVATQRRSDEGVRRNSDEVLSGLRAKLEDQRRSQARRAGWTRRVVPMGLVRIDARLPGGGLPCGAITEILSDEPGAGSMTLALRVARKKGRRDVGTKGQRDRRVIVVVDVCGDFYPPAVAEHGVSLDRIVVIRTTNEQDAFWAVDQSLRCSGVSLVIAPLRHLDERLSRRLQLAAESSGAIGLILRPASPRIKSFAAVQILVEGAREGIEGSCHTVASGPRAGRFSNVAFGTCLDAVDEVHLCRITLLKVREGMPAESLLVDLHHEAGALPIYALPVERSSAKRA